MLLSPQLFDRIVGISACKEPDCRGTVLPAGCKRAPERRQAARIAFGQRTQICPDGGPRAGLWETVMLQDISQSGIGFISHEPMLTGQNFMLKLTDLEGDAIRIRCGIQRCERGGYGQTAFIVGAAFQQLIVHQPIRITDEDGEDGVENETAPVELTPATEPAGFRITGAAMARAAVSLLKAVDPSQWLRKADDFSSVG